MGGLKKLEIPRFLLLVLLPGLLSGLPAGFGRHIEKPGLLSSALPAGPPAESGGPTLFISETFLTCGQPMNQNRARLWRQPLPPAVLAPLAKVFSGAALWQYRFHFYSPRLFFHILVVSLLLGGRAPPRFVEQSAF
ncbi:MAG: hypothetical protein LBH51_03610 [Treponema sp.]|nr:hypothetical protein [Treponema sp.]